MCLDRVLASWSHVCINILKLEQGSQGYFVMGRRVLARDSNVIYVFQLFQEHQIWTKAYMHA